ncbi:hypothetical protein SteCoe_8168 [Stentor coeruleus]|uniref:GAF domain-containing protein n=1 Tax=Stentor coeruleus TaxID=5963 RepID=A0A1R2CKW5_9CILI|nr:hypothetical protein SteCoe_8168 [Stentor coeruleus]
MSDSYYSLHLSPVPRLARNIRYEAKKTVRKYKKTKSPTHKVSDFQDKLFEKESIIHSLKLTLKKHERKILNLEKNNAQLKQIIGILSKHITEELNDVLPPLPNLPDDNIFRLSPIIPKNKKKLKAKSLSVDLSSVMNTISQSSKLNPQTLSTKSFIFDASLQNNLYQDFKEAEFLKNILDAQLSREEMQKVVRFLLGKTSQDMFLHKARTILFESLSFFLSLRNVAFLNSPEIFLPRTLEMLVDILEVEKITVLAYDDNTLYSIAVTSDMPEAITVEKNFGHFAYVDEPLIISVAHEDSRFDKNYDQICNFVTRNLACVQIKINDKVLGILECANKKTEFMKEDIVLMMHVSKQLAYGQIGQESREKMSMVKRSLSLNKGSIESCKSALLSPVLYKLCESISELLNCERVSIFLYDSTSKYLTSIVSLGISGSISFPIDKGIAGLAYQTNTVINADSQHPSFFKDIDKNTNFTTREILAVPISTIGVLECLNKKNLAKFSKTDEKRLESLSQTIQAIFESAQNLSSVLYTADINEFCLQNISTKILHINNQSIIQKLNLSASKMLELKSEEIIGANITEALRLYPEILESYLDSVKSEENLSFKSLNTKDGFANIQYVKVSGLEDYPSYLIFIDFYD